MYEALQEQQKRAAMIDLLLKTAILLLFLSVLFFSMSTAANQKNPAQLFEQAKLSLQADMVVPPLAVGDQFTYRVKVTPQNAAVFPVENELLSVKEIHEEGQAPDMRVFQIQALKAGSAQTGAVAGASSVSFPVKILPEQTLDTYAQTYSSKTKYLLLVNLTRQRVGVFTGEKGNWKKVKEYLCSSGAAGYDTPTGTFTVQERGPWFFNQSLGSGARWWVRFNGPYLFHSLEMDENKNVKDTRLGTPLSHGCVRLNIDEAKWIHDAIPAGSTVVVYK